jgi:NAD(P)-dependent dehydrogenase (short-subunit alcohol dehydrogenase family)
VASARGKFASRVVAISGACGGFGREMARQFQAEGASLLLLDRDADRLAELRAELGGETSAIVYDQADDAAIDKALAQVAGVDVFVNNAGYTLRKSLVDFTAAEMRLLLDVDLYGAMRMAIGMARIMIRQQGGVIVNIASQLAFASEPERGVYSVAKAGIVQFTRSSAREWAPHGVRTFAIAPGPAETGMTANMSEEARDSLLSKIPSRQMIQPDDIAKAAVFLSSSDGRSFVGQTMVVDSGYLLH